jgi:uncharacterized protein (DUF2384 family)
MGSYRDWRFQQLEDSLLGAAAALGGEAASKLWYEIPIPDLDGLSPRELLRRDRANEVFDHLATLEMSLPFANWNASER